MFLGFHFGGETDSLIKIITERRTWQVAADQSQQTPDFRDLPVNTHRYCNLSYYIWKNSLECFGLVKIKAHFRWTMRRFPFLEESVFPCATRSERGLAGCRQHPTKVLPVVCPCCPRSYTHFKGMQNQAASLASPQHYALYCLQTWAVSKLTAFQMSPLPHSDTFQLMFFTSDIISNVCYTCTKGRCALFFLSLWSAGSWLPYWGTLWMEEKKHEVEVRGNGGETEGKRETDRESEMRNSGLVFISLALSQPVN